MMVVALFLLLIVSLVVVCDSNSAIDDVWIESKNLGQW